jgi:hypothetical protein
VKIANRKQLSELFAISVSGLRLRAHRIRRRLEACVLNCCGKAAE